jgi:NAD(P)-dependent dehydrogenase (short-subunit alcohol dehydrogenase family)
MFANKVVFITGAASGMGFDAACRFVDNGAYVIGCDRSQAGLSKLETYASEHHGRYESILLDLSDIPAFVKAEDKVRLLGRLDILINCAGICSGTPLDTISEEEWERTYAVNVKGPFFLTRTLLPYIKKGENPTIINISSMAGFTGGILSNPAYSSSKAAVTCMTKNLAKYCAPMGIRVNEISPGTAITAMTENWLGSEKLKDFAPQVPMGRLAEAGDVAKVILFLASDAAGFITGQTIHVNGGMYIP